MRWFKHDSDANMDAKLKRLRMKYGMQGYGLYWYCLELIAREVTSKKITFELEHDAEVIAFDTGMSPDLVEDMMRYMVQLGLFQMSGTRLSCTSEQLGVPEGQQAVCRNIRAEDRQAVFADDGFACRHCGSQENLTVDHIVPFSKGGACHPDNFQTLCQSCNSSKGSRVPHASATRQLQDTRAKAAKVQKVATR